LAPVVLNLLSVTGALGEKRHGAAHVSVVGSDKKAGSRSFPPVGERAMRIMAMKCRINRLKQICSSTGPNYRK
jgi:hypothetical protein